VKAQKAACERERQKKLRMLREAAVIESGSLAGRPGTQAYEIRLRQMAQFSVPLSCAVRRVR
jgi:hypothetical protein